MLEQPCPPMGPQRAVQHKQLEEE